MKLDKRHKWASCEDGELVFYECVVCGEERTETTLARDLRLSIEAEKEKKKKTGWIIWDELTDHEAWLRLYTPTAFPVPKLPEQTRKTITFNRLPRIELPTPAKDS